MIGLLLQGVLETRANFILAAAAVCTVMAMTLVLLMRNSATATTRQRLFGAAWIALVAGVGVWTTHFVAMIGYRPDAALTYDLELTSISILVGIVFVGLPIAASEIFRDRLERIGLGAFTALGVAGMHLTGMTAVENCLPTYNPLVLTAGIVISILCFSFALTRVDTDSKGLLGKAAGIIAGVCSLHFIAMASVSLNMFDMGETGIGGVTLSIMVAIVALSVFAATMIGTFNHRRALATRRLQGDDTLAA